MRVGVVVLALVGVLGVVGPLHAQTGIVRIVIPGALAAPTGTSADGQVTLRIGVGLPVFQVNAAGAVVGGVIATATFAQWSDTVLTPSFSSPGTLMVFRLPDGLMVIATGVGTPNGLAATFSATAPYPNLTGGWDMVAGSNPADALVTFTYDLNPHIKETGLVTFVAGGALTSHVAKSIAGIATVDVLRNIPIFGVVGNAKGGEVGNLVGYVASDIVGHASEFVEHRAIHMPTANLYLLYGCASPNPGSGITCLVGGTGFATHLSGPVSEIAGMFRKATIAGVVDADLVLELDAMAP